MLGAVRVQLRFVLLVLIGSGREESLTRVEVDRHEVEPVARFRVQNGLDGVRARLVDGRGRQARVQTRVVGVVVIEVSLARQAGLLAGSVKRGRVHAKDTMCIFVVDEAILDDAGDLGHVLRVVPHLSLDDRRLNKDRLAVRSGYPERIQLVDSRLDHAGDDSRRGVAFLDLVLAAVQPSLGAATRFSGQADGGGVRESFVHVRGGNIHDVHDASLDGGHAFACEDRDGRLDTVHGIEHHGKRVGRAHLALEAVGARVNCACRAVLFVLADKGTHRLDDAGLV